MSTQAVSGVEGETSLGDEITKFTLNCEVESLNATSMSSDGWHEAIAGLVNVSGSAESNVLIGAQQTLASATFTMPDGTPATVDITITNCKPTTPAEGVVGWAVDFVGTFAGGGSMENFKRNAKIKDAKTLKTVDENEVVKQTN